MLRYLMADARQSDRENETRALHREIFDATQRARFQMFFAGLIFAIVSFVGAHAISGEAFLWLKVSEVVALVCLLFSGVILLFRLGGIRYTEKAPQEEDISSVCFLAYRCWRWLLDAVFNRERYYWMLFIFGMTLLVLNRSVLLFCS